MIITDGIIAGGRVSTSSSQLGGAILARELVESIKRSSLVYFLALKEEMIQS